MRTIEINPRSFFYWLIVFIVGAMTVAVSEAVADPVGGSAWPRADLGCRAEVRLQLRVFATHPEWHTRTAPAPLFD